MRVIFQALELQGLVVGDYEFKLTVTDTDGVSNSTTATVTVNKSKNYLLTSYLLWGPLCFTFATLKAFLWLNRCNGFAFIVLSFYC